MVRAGKFLLILAQTPCQKTMGLQNVESLPYNTLMLFTDVGPRALFHTRNCKFPLEIISIDKNLRILAIWTAPVGLDKVGITPARTVNVLEAPIGWVAGQKLKVGDQLLFLKT